jgi:hypothetical protein
MRIKIGAARSMSKLSMSRIVDIRTVPDLAIGAVL